MLVYRSMVAAAMCTGALLVGCVVPDQPTDLRKDGPPNVTAVTVMSDLKTSIDPRPPRISRLIESATFCRPGDEKRPGLVGLPDISTYQVCPEDFEAPSPTLGAVEGAPPSWFVRVVFDKLLDPNVEDLVPMDPTMPAGTLVGTLADTQPVTLTCNGIDVPYGGYYVPNGNRISWPLGPALFVQPLSAVSVPTGALCKIDIKDMVHNKRGESVPNDQRSYTFKIGPMNLRFSVIGQVKVDGPAAAADGTIELDPHVPVKFFWTAAFNTPDPAQIQIFEGPNLSGTTGDGDPDPAVCGTGGTMVPMADTIQVANDPAVGATKALVMDVKLNTHPTDPMVDKRVWKPTTTYRIEFGPNAKLTPKQGGAVGMIPAGYKLCFHTTAATK